MKNQYVTEIKGDLLDFPNEINILGHCANCHCAMGGGIAASIAARYPEAQDSDNKTQSGDRSKLGTISWAKLKESSKMNPKFIANIYGQFSPSTGERAVNYEAIARGIETIMKGASGQKASKSGEYIVGFPCRMGCDLARGEWPIIRQMIWTYALKYEVKTIIVDYNG
tara:strand:+ start:3677 stop:4180 length:504 start_codon:yes stop_codon:yes gene_type:complete